MKIDFLWLLGSIAITICTIACFCAIFFGGVLGVILGIAGMWIVYKIASKSRYFDD